MHFSLLASFSFPLHFPMAKDSTGLSARQPRLGVSAIRALRRQYFYKSFCISIVLVCSCRETRPGASFCIEKMQQSAVSLSPRPAREGQAHLLPDQTALLLDLLKDRSSLYQVCVKLRHPAPLIASSPFPRLFLCLLISLSPPSSHALCAPRVPTSR